MFGYIPVVDVSRCTLSAIESVGVIVLWGLSDPSKVVFPTSESPVLRKKRKMRTEIPNSKRMNPSSPSTVFPF